MSLKESCSRHHKGDIVAAAVALSTAMGASINGEAALRYLPDALLAVTKTLLVCSGAVTIVSVLNGFTWVASTSTTGSLCPEI